MRVNLSASDLEFAKKFNLTVEDLIGFIEDQEEIYQREEEGESEELSPSSPEVIYHAW